MVLPAIFAWRSSLIPLSWLPLRGFGERIAQLCANFGRYFRPESPFYFHEVSTKVSILAVEAKSLIFLWRVFAESTHDPAVIINPVTRHVWPVARHEAEMSR